MANLQRQLTILALYIFMMKALRKCFFSKQKSEDDLNLTRVWVKTLRFSLLI
jgi:hypothetical protein